MDVKKSVWQECRDVDCFEYINVLKDMRNVSQ